MANLRSSSGNTKKREVKQDAAEHPAFIVLGFQYDRKFILPIEQGKTILGALASARCLCEDYNKPKRLLPSIGRIEVQYMTATEIAAMELEEAIDPNS